MRIAVLTAAALVGFAANSLLCRAALRGGAIDAGTFTALRLGSGAVVLGVLAFVAARRSKAQEPPAPAGSWASAAALAGYAIAFSYAYLELEAGTGALLLFGAVQLTMIVGGLVRGERPTAAQWTGWSIALAGLVVLTSPGIDPPPAGGAALMLGAGVAWGIYSLRGRGVARPLATTAGNFVRALPAAAVLAVVAGVRHASVTPRGAALAAASGGLASGLGYTLWYAAVPALGATRAAVVQLAVPVVTAIAAMVMLGESPRVTLAIGGGAIVVGLGLALLGARRAAP